VIPRVVFPDNLFRSRKGIQVSYKKFIKIKKCEKQMEICGGGCLNHHLQYPTIQVARHETLKMA
jgi:hypothetical protein